MENSDLMTFAALLVLTGCSVGTNRQGDVHAVSIRVSGMVKSQGIT